jgi:peptide/nickel transport system ATP-binding protein
VTAALRIDGLTVSYARRSGSRRVLDAVDLEVAPGEAYGLVGESGCGKTTLAMAVMRYLPLRARAEAGTIEVAGEDLGALGRGALRQRRGRRLAMVPQDPGSALNPSLRVGEQVAEVYRYARGLARGAALEAAAAMLERVQLAEPGRILRRYPHQLSGGQQQRVMIAMALAAEPALLLLDEPTTGLDATVEAEILDLVARLRAELDCAIVLISHNLAVVSRVCERVGVLYAGRLVEEAPSDELFGEPRHPYTRALLRCLPRPGMRKDRDRLEPIAGSLPALGAAVPGCVYAERCPIARERCHAEAPPPVPVAPGHRSRCFYHEEVAGIAPAPSGAAPAAAPAGEPLLVIQELTKVYRGGLVAVDGVGLELRRGETFGLVGESGSGKTSLARTVAGLVEPTSGRIELDGRELAPRAAKRPPAVRRRLQMVFQNPDGALNPRHSARHSARRILGRSVERLGGQSGPQRDARVAELAAAVRLGQDDLDRRPPALSGGQKQRVAISRSFAGAPALVLCDEPASALDVSVQAAILNLLADLQARHGVSYLFISHDLAVVRYLADRIGVMYLGQIVDTGPAEAVFAPPHHPYTEALVSAIPTIGGGRERIRLRGPLPSAAAPPSGCRFHTRCPRYLGDVCRDQAPPWQRDGDGHAYRCHIPPAELRRAQAWEDAPA